MHTKLLALAAGAMLAGVGVAHAATVTGDLNLRAGPGINYPIIEAMPAGAHVNIRSCSGGWCRLSFNGEVGWASDNYLSGRSRTTTVYRSRRVYPAPEYYAPDYVYEEPSYSYFGPPLGYAYAPGFSFGIGFGGGGWHHHWRH